MEEDEDDLYAPEEDVVQPKEESNDPAAESEAMDEDEEDEDSDIEIVTEQKDSEKPEPPSKNLRTETQRAVPVKSETPQPLRRAAPSPLPRIDAPVKSTPTPPQRSGASYPAVKTSTIDVDAKPMHEPSGKPITEVDIDADLGEADKPWRLPGADQTDFFNYGFDEFTWASYCLKQENLRKEAKEQKKQLEEMQNMFGGSGTSSSTAAPMPGLGDMPPDMQQAMQSMIASGVDPNQMDFGMFMQMMNPGQQGMGGQGYGQQGQNQQQQQQQQMGGYGYGGHEARPNNRGRGGRRW